VDTHPTKKIAQETGKVESPQSSKWSTPCSPRMAGLRSKHLLLKDLFEKVPSWINFQDFCWFRLQNQGLLVVKVLFGELLWDLNYFMFDVRKPASQVI